MELFVPPANGPGIEFYSRGAERGADNVNNDPRRRVDPSFVKSNELSSPFLELRCPCGYSLNADGVCVNDKTESMPFLRPTDAQRRFNAALYQGPPALGISRADYAMMARAAFQGS
jgi:hypothetical protein